MISRRTKEYCCDDISLIENYELAITDTSQIWECHHKAEILPCGVYSIADLEKFGLYWHRPASELILLTSIEHHRLHNANLSQNTIDKKRGAMLGKISGMKGKHHSEEQKRKLSQVFSNKRPQNKTKRKDAWKIQRP